MYKILAVEIKTKKKESMHWPREEAKPSARKTVKNQARQRARTLSSVDDIYSDTHGTTTTTRRKSASSIRGRTNKLFENRKTPDPHSKEEQNSNMFYKDEKHNRLEILRARNSSERSIYPPSDLETYSFEEGRSPSPKRDHSGRYLVSQGSRRGSDSSSNSMISAIEKSFRAFQRLTADSFIVPSSTKKVQKVTPVVGSRVSAPISPPSRWGGNDSDSSEIKFILPGSLPSNVGKY